MAAPNVEALQSLTGTVYVGDKLVQAEAVLQVVTSLASGYTRGRGFTADGEPYSDVVAVILRAALRYLTNMEQVRSRSMGPFRVDFGDGFAGWTTTELMVLNRYRQRAM